MWQYWLNSEIRELLVIRGEEEVRRKVSGTVRDTVVYKYMADKLKQRGHVRTPRQVINKLRSLKKKYLTIKDKSNPCGKDRVDWQFYELCDNVFGNSASPSSSMAGSSAVYPPPLGLSSPPTERDDCGVKSETEEATITTTTIATPIPEPEDLDIYDIQVEETTITTTTTTTLDIDCTQVRVESAEEERPESSSQHTRGIPRPVRRRKRTGIDQLSSTLSKVMDELREMDKAEGAREDARFAMLFEQNRKMMETQERLDREVRENERMLFEMLLARLPVQTPRYTNGA